MTEARGVLSAASTGNSHYRTTTPMSEPFPSDALLTSEPHDALMALINNWLWEIPIEHAPSDAVVRRAIETVSRRDDAATCQDIIAMMHEYLSS
jgi:hypothetical protein